MSNLSRIITEVRFLIKKILEITFQKLKNKSSLYTTSYEKIIVFTRYPEVGKVKTRLIPLLGPKGAAELQRKMTERVIQKAKSASIFRGASLEIRYDGDRESMTAWFGEGLQFVKQGPGDIGVRMKAAFQDAFRSGFKRAVLVGADCPEITSLLLEKALDAQEECDLVLGPAFDGGYYLIGLKKIYPELFTSISWGSHNVLNETIEKAKKLGLSFQLVDSLSDIDRPEDLERMNIINWSKHPNSWRFSSPGQTNIQFSVVIPTLNEETNVAACLDRVLEVEGTEVIVVDGGSIDRTVEVAESFGVKVVNAPRGRAIQMNIGASKACGEILVFLHADTILPPRWDRLVEEELSKTGVVAGAFELGFQPKNWRLEIIAELANFRSRAFQLPYGDQAIFIRKNFFCAVGGYKEMPIMEDFELITRLRKLGKITITQAKAITSSRRWQNLGLFRTTALNQIIIATYLLGIKPERLATLYNRRKGVMSPWS